MFSNLSYNLEIQYRQNTTFNCYVLFLSNRDLFFNGLSPGYNFLTTFPLEHSGNFCNRSFRDFFFEKK